MGLQVSYVLVLLLTGLCTGQACKPKKLENGRAIAEEVERRTVKRITEKQILAEALRVGDSLTHLADSLAQHRLQANLHHGGIAAALQVYPPTSYPEVQALALKYGARPVRQHLPAQAHPLRARARMRSNTELLYTRPLYLSQTCMPCHGKAISQADRQLLQHKKPSEPMGGLQLGDQAGFWVVPIKRKAILDILTLKGMKKKPGPG